MDVKPTKELTLIIDAGVLDEASVRAADFGVSVQHYIELATRLFNNDNGQENDRSKLGRLEAKIKRITQITNE